MVTLPFRAVNSAVYKCVIQKQNLEDFLHSISKGTEIGMWQACWSQMDIKAVCPKVQAVCPCWYFHRHFRWHIRWVFSNVEVDCESSFLFSSFLVHLIMRGRKPRVC